MIATRWILWSALLLTPCLSQAGSKTDFALSLAKSGHNAYCIYELDKSVDEKFMGTKGMLQGNFKDLRKYNDDLRKLSDEQYAEKMRLEIWEVARCHPMASALLGGFPGKDYLAPLDLVTAVPGSLDRKATYAVWAYDFMYRSVSEYVDEATKNLKGSGEGSGADTQARSSPLNEAARKLVQFVPKVVPKPDHTPYPRQQSSNGLEQPGSTASTPRQQVAEQARSVFERMSAGFRKDPPSSIPRSEDAPSVLPGPDNRQTEGLSSLNLEAAKRLLEKMEDVTPQEVAEGGGGKVIRDWLQEEGVEQIGGDVGPVRPTIPVYALQGRELVMYEINSVHLLFSGSTGPAQFCYERYNSEYPTFARLFNAGKATQKAVATLSRQEAAEIMKFFNAGAKVPADSFILSDLVAIAGGISDETAGNALANCVSQAQKGNIQEGAGSPEWLRGSVVRFESEDKLWQTLIMMLAAKRIEVSQELMPK